MCGVSFFSSFPHTTVPNNEIVLHVNQFFASFGVLSPKPDTAGKTAGTGVKRASTAQHETPRRTCRSRAFTGGNIHSDA